MTEDEAGDGIVLEQKGGWDREEGDGPNLVHTNLGRPRAAERLVSPRASRNASTRGATLGRHRQWSRLIKV